MSYIKWSEAYEVGFREIDLQHQKLFEVINNFHDSIEEKNILATKELLINLFDYALTHFRTEEKYFDMFNYPESEAHKEEHQEFEGKVAGFQMIYQLKGNLNTAMISEFLKDWIINHVLIFDRKYIKCFSENDLH